MPSSKAPYVWTSFYQILVQDIFKQFFNFEYAFSAIKRYRHKETSNS